MSIAIRAMKQEDIVAVVPIIDTAYGRAGIRTHDRLERSLRRPSHRSLYALVDGVPAGTVAIERYGSLAYVGAMAVAPAFQGRGVGSALMTHLVDEADAGGVRTLLLDATKAGERLYPRFGFVAEGAVSVWQRPGTRTIDVPPPGAVELAGDGDVDAIARLDAAIFGADRSALVRDLADEAAGRIALVRDGRDDAVAAAVFVHDGVIGPWIARSRDDAEHVLRAALTLGGGRDLRAFIPVENETARTLVLDHGFEEDRQLTHMRRGDPALAQRVRLYGQASLGHG